MDCSRKAEIELTNFVCYESATASGSERGRAEVAKGWERREGEVLLSGEGGARRREVVRWAQNETCWIGARFERV